MTKIDQLRKNPSELELYYALLTAWFVGEAKDVKNFSDQLAKTFPDFKQVNHFGYLCSD